MHTVAAAAPPAETIRSYLLDEGTTRVPFSNLLTSWDMSTTPSTDERQQIVADLADYGVCVDRPLTDLEADDEVSLSLRKPSQPSIPTLPYVGPSPVAAVPSAVPTGVGSAYPVGPPTAIDGMVPAAYVPAVPVVPAPPRRWIRRTLLSVFGVLLLAIAAGGAFLAGRDTRLSDQQVDAKLAAQSQQDARKAKASEAAAVKDARLAQRKADGKVWQKRLERATKKAREAGYSTGSAAGYSSGKTDGYSAGNADGVEEGLVKGSDELTCSDDMDVPLPACNF